MATAHFVDFHQFNENYLHELRAQDVTTEAHFVAYFSKILHNKLRRRLMCPEHIKDVQQETLLRAWAAVRAEGGIRQPERFGAFVSSVCNNILRESYRSRARTKPLEDLRGTHRQIARARRHAAGGRNQNAGAARAGKDSTQGPKYPAGRLL